MRAAVALPSLALVLLTGCGAAPAADPLADRGDPAHELVATVVRVPAGEPLDRAVADALAAATRRRIAAGTLPGPLLGVDCEARETGADGSLVRDCLAVRARQGGRIPIRIGASYLVRIDEPTRRFGWCEFRRVGGEGATEAPDAYRPPAPACGGDGAP